MLICVVLHNILKTHQGRLDRAPNPADDIAAIANEVAVYWPNENDKNPSREVKHQQDLLTDYLIMLVHFLGRRKGSEM